MTDKWFYRLGHGSATACVAQVPTMLIAHWAGNTAAFAATVTIAVLALLVIVALGRHCPPRQRGPWDDDGPDNRGGWWEPPPGPPPPPVGEAITDADLAAFAAWAAQAREKG